ncbi:predicted protein [Arabidopsis lyrata subsp. lyrata]|uniref:Predicted protein n=1 Tax=Arabidopsis lyrata subsp. lyrata TaxID=81972 RepID=D7LLX6_ARALL|nr:predicted protein [Arabidopsis lyrata subsp. lyrata]
MDSWWMKKTCGPELYILYLTKKYRSRSDLLIGFVCHNTPVSTVVSIESPFPPSDKIGITSIQRAAEEIIPMKEMKMDWRRAALRHLKDERVRKFEYCLPYFYDPFKEDELEQSSEVQILYPSEPPVVCEFDWRFDRLEVFVDKLIEDQELSAEQKEEFKEFVK